MFRDLVEEGVRERLVLSVDRTPPADAERERDTGRSPRALAVA
jgi:hypothetical protein